MNDRYRIRYLKTAKNDLLDIFEYIKKDKPTAAESLLEKFDRLLSQLADTPFMGVIPKDERLEKLGYRILIIDKYLVFYVVKGGVVQIRRVIHGARRYSLLL